MAESSRSAGLSPGAEVDGRPSEVGPLRDSDDAVRVSSPSVSIVIPAYNEERRLGRLLPVLSSTAASELARVGPELREIVIIDDGSVDRTVALLRDAAATDETIVPVVQGLPNQGKGAALAAGARAARGDLVLFCDVDFSTPITEFEKLYRSLQAGADVAIGSRDVEGSLVLNAPAYRKRMGRVFNIVVQRVTGLPFRDTQCGFKLMRASVARALLERQLVAGYAFDVELLMRARDAGFATEEVPVTYIHDPDSRVRPLKAAPRMTMDVLSVVYRLRSGRSRA